MSEIHFQVHIKGLAEDAVRSSRQGLADIANEHLSSSKGMTDDFSRSSGHAPDVRLAKCVGRRIPRLRLRVCLQLPKEIEEACQDKSASQHVQILKGRFTAPGFAEHVDPCVFEDIVGLARGGHKCLGHRDGGYDESTLGGFDI